MALPPAAKVAVGVVVLLAASVASVGALAATGVLDAPQVQDVSTEWGPVTEETAVIEVTVVLDNPNPVGVPPVAGLAYTASLNDVTVAEGRQGGVGLAPGTNRLELSVAVQNDRIDDWWVTHVNGDESSTLTIEPAVTGPLGLRAGLPPQTQPVETDFLGSLGTAEATTFEVEGEPFLRIGGGSARWGQATAETTPLVLSATLTNLHDAPIALDGLGYVVRMNDVTLGEGTDDGSFVVEPGTTETVELPAALDTPKLSDWWVSHLERDEVTDLSIEVFGIVERSGGETVAVPLVNQSATVETDLLGGGATDVAASDAAPEVDVAPPTITGTSLGWGEVTDDTTEVEAVVGVDNPNPDSALAELLRLEVDQTVVINGVTVADDTTAVDEVPAGRGEVTFTARLDNSRVPRWWARHINDGERSTVTFRATGTADVGITAFPLSIPTREGSFSTDLLAGLNEDEPQPVTVGGTRVFTIVSTTGTWGTATAERAPVDVEAVLRNDGFTDVTVREVTYEVAIGDVVLADDVAPGSWTVSPGETETLALTMTLDNSRMDEWWVAHVRNGESSTLTIDVYATVEAGGSSERVRLDSIGGNRTIETDVLGEG